MFGFDINARTFSCWHRCVFIYHTYSVSIVSRHTQTCPCMIMYKLALMLTGSENNQLLTILSDWYMLTSVLR